MQFFLLSFSSLVLLCGLPQKVFACSATPQAAVMAMVAGGRDGDGASGYRVQDLHVDMVSRRVWVRVQRCGDASAPAVMLPLMASVDGELVAPAVAKAAVVPVAASVAAPAAAKEMLIRMGQTVTVLYASGAVHMELEGTAEQAGGAGDAVTVLLKRREGQAADEASHRIRGTVRAQGLVEVLP